MHALFVQFSGLVGLLVLLNGLWDNTPVERTVFSAATAGMVIYLALIVSEALVRRILAYTPPQLAEEGAGGGRAGAGAGGDGGDAAPEPSAD